MLINLQKLMKLPVVTESGTKLGKIHDVKIDVESHVILEYLIKSFLSVKQTYIIRPIHVKMITAEKMVVYDAVVKSKELKKIRASAGPEMAGSAMSVQDSAE